MENNEVPVVPSTVLVVREWERDKEGTTVTEPALVDRIES